MKHTLTQLFFHRLPVIIYCIAIFIQSSFPAPEMIPKAFSNDKVLHFGGYALLGALFLRALMTYPIRKKRTLILLSILCASLYGVSDEFHQSFVPSRNADVYDVLADTVGSVLGVAAYYLLNRFSGLQKR